MGLPSKATVSNRYNWRATKTPERPYVHSYHTSLVDKIFLCMKPNPQTGEPVQVHLNFNQALERIQMIDVLTDGIPKIMYLVGWQFEGHDSGYPDWSQVNPHLKRPQDRTAADSLRWLMKAARQHHTIVSLHINMQDAYATSPSWDTYRRGRLFVGKGGVWGGEQAYLIDYAKEWEMGLAQKRIDDLCRLLPISEAGTIHIDAFWPNGPELETPLGAMRRIVRYWRNKGIDVTVEGIVTSNLDKGLIGLSPMAWHINFDLWKRPDEFNEADYMDIPASLFCGGVDHSYRGLVFGTSMQGEGLDSSQMDHYQEEFCLQTLPWQYLNRFERLELIRAGDRVQVEFSDGLSLDADLAAQYRSIRHDDLLIQDGLDVFVPALWKNRPEILAFSKHGYSNRWWNLPTSWERYSSVEITRLTLSGLVEPQLETIENGAVELSLTAGEVVTIRPGLSSTLL